MAVSPLGPVRSMVEISAGICFRLISKAPNLVSFEEYPACRAAVGASVKSALISAPRFPQILPTNLGSRSESRTNGGGAVRFNASWKRLLTGHRNHHLASLFTSAVRSLNDVKPAGPIERSVECDYERTVAAVATAARRATAANPVIVRCFVMGKGSRLE